MFLYFFSVYLIKCWKRVSAVAIQTDRALLCIHNGKLYFCVVGHFYANFLNRIQVSFLCWNSHSLSYNLSRMNGTEVMNFRALDMQSRSVLTCLVTKLVPSSFILIFLFFFLLNTANPGSHLYNQLNLTRSGVITVQSKCLDSPEMLRSFCNTFLSVIFHVSTVELYLGTDLDRDSPVHRYGFDLIFSAL